MGKGVKHYFRDGKLHKLTHKMPNGKLHSGKTHTKTSKPLFHKKNYLRLHKRKKQCLRHQLGNVKKVRILVVD